MRLLHLAALAGIVIASPISAQTNAASQSATAGTDEFARTAAENNLSEVLLAAIALQKTGDKRVQDDAWTMLDHHSRAMGDLAEALGPNAANLPGEPSAQQRANLDRLKQLSGSSFDQAYFAYQLGAHQRAIDLYDRATRLPDAKIAQYARVTAPVLRAHREITQLRQAQPAQPMPGQ